MMIKDQNLHQLGVQILPQLCRDPAYWHLLTKSEWTEKRLNIFSEIMQKICVKASSQTGDIEVTV